MKWFQNSGFVFNKKKSIMEAARKAEFLGVILNMKANILAIPSTKFQNLKKFTTFVVKKDGGQQEKYLC